MSEINNFADINMTTRQIRLILIFGEVFLFFVSVGLLAYFCQKSYWIGFWSTVIICTIIFGFLKLSEHGPILKLLQDLERKQTNLARRFESWGIDQVFNMRFPDEIDERNRVNRTLISEGNDFCLLAETGASYINPEVRRHWDSLKMRLDAGCRFRILIIDPLCSSKQLRNQVNRVEGKIDPKLRIDILKNLERDYGPRVEVRFTSEIYCSVFITDKAIIYDPYHIGREDRRIENYFIAMQISNVGEAKAYWLLRSHFDTLWNCAESFKAWQQRASEILGSSNV